MSGKSPKNGPTEKRHGWFRRNVPKVVIIVIAVAILTLIAEMPKRDRQSAPTEPAPVNVKVMTVVAEPQFPETFDLPAVVEPNRIVTVSAEIEGRIECIPLTEGSRVQADNLLVQLNTDLIQPQLDRAIAQLARDEIEYKRMKELVDMNATSQSDLDNATTERDMSKAQLAEIRARKMRTEILAPINGILNDIPVEEGEYVLPGTPVAEIVDTDTVKVVVDIPERDITFFDIGRKAQVFASYQDREISLEGTITFISELADRQTRSTSMEITLSNQDGFLRSGQIVRVHLTRQILQDAILIPLLAVIPMEEGNAVYVVNSTKTQRRIVELGVIKKDRVQVRRGLQPGDQLIISGHRFIAPAQNVNVVEENE